ncbi:uncharacterized protein (DUF305 family) [Pseudonocardia sediminis]|uniref:Uncharacterized protein (DUF305 family) n=2 Tax=Pseudonocardia sediminis TaxID=1397368 RepID=A0A4Q7UV76_PSEST|nr:uncharacterized protein (DUF305 family) [Pseudonocardia sediminis]
MKIKNVALAATSLAAALVLSACGSGDSPGTAAGAPPVPSSAASPGSQQVSAEHNAADIAFVQGMIPHHRQAVEMAKLADDRAGDGVKDLATRIEQAQGPEIEQMRGFLTAWGAPESGPMSSMPGMESGAMGGMQGMMSGQEMAQLGQASGAEFDRMFLQMMTAHHEGAVQMARTELSAGVNPQAKALAQQIIDAQQAEITEMRGLLG